MINTWYVCPTWQIYDVLRTQSFTLEWYTNSYQEITYSWKSKCGLQECNHGKVWYKILPDAVLSNMVKGKSFDLNIILIFLFIRNSQQDVTSQYFISCYSLHVSDTFRVHHQEINKIDCICSLWYGNRGCICSQFYWSPDDGHGTCPKHVENNMK
jgi:hypothetical protein